MNAKNDNNVGVKDGKVGEVPKDLLPLEATRQQIETVEDTAIAVYQDRSIVRELVARLMAFHPAAAEVGPSGMLMAAQLALTMGASPLPGINEIHIWKDYNGVTVSPGINYWRRRAIYYGGTWWEADPRPMTEAELELYGVKATEVGAICRGLRVSDMEKWTARGLEWQLVVSKFCETGIGIASTEYSNRKKTEKEAKTGRPVIWTAIKRCETDILKKLYPYQPGESFTPGAGLERSASGAIKPAYDEQWADVDPVLVEEDAERVRAEKTREQFPQTTAIDDLDEVNALLGLGAEKKTVEEVRAEKARAHAERIEVVDVDGDTIFVDASVAAGSIQERAQRLRDEEAQERFAEYDLREEALRAELDEIEEATRNMNDRQSELDELAGKLAQQQAEIAASKKSQSVGFADTLTRYEAAEALSERDSKAIELLNAEGIEDPGRLSDDQLRDIDGIGPKRLETIREFFPFVDEDDSEQTALQL